MGARGRLFTSPSLRLVSEHGLEGTAGIVKTFAPCLPAGLSSPPDFPPRWTFLPAGLSSPTLPPPSSLPGSQRCARRGCPVDSGAPGGSAYSRGRGGRPLGARCWGSGARGGRSGQGGSSWRVLLQGLAFPASLSSPWWRGVQSWAGRPLRGSVRTRRPAAGPAPLPCVLPESPAAPRAHCLSRKQDSASVYLVSYPGSKE